MGTPELANALEPLVSQYDAILMANHGVVAYGEDLSHAYMKMETVKHFPRIALVAHLLGHQQLLGAQEIEKLILARSKYQGAKSAAPMPLRIPNGTWADGKDHPSAGSESASHTLRSNQRPLPIAAMIASWPLRAGTLSRPESHSRTESSPAAPDTPLKPEFPF
jgi:hypothetical protein